MAATIAFLLVGVVISLFVIGPVVRDSYKNNPPLNK